MAKPTLPKFRSTIDLQPVNEATEGDTWPMLHLEVEILDLKESKHYDSVGYLGAFWQTLLHFSSYCTCGIICPRRQVCLWMSITRDKHNGVHFQSTGPNASLQCKVLFSFGWKISFDCNNRKATTGKFEKILKILAQCNFILSAKKYSFYKTSESWCSRVIDPHSYCLDLPKNFANEQ